MSEREREREREREGGRERVAFMSCVHMLLLHNTIHLYMLLFV